MTYTQLSLAVLGVLVVVLVPVITALWRFASKVRDNTTAVDHLAVVVEGSATALGLAARVRSLEDWRVSVEATERARASLSIPAQASSGGP